MAEEKKTRGKSQLGQGRFSEREVARQQKSYDRRLLKAATEGRDLNKVKRGWALEQGGESKWARDPGEREWRKKQKAESGPTKRWSKAQIAAENVKRTSGPETKAQKAAATSALNVEESKRKGTYTGKASKLKQKVKVKSRGGAAGFNPKLGRYSPTDIVRAGRGQIPKKKM